MYTLMVYIYFYILKNKYKRLTLLLDYIIIIYTHMRKGTWRGSIHSVHFSKESIHQTLHQVYTKVYTFWNRVKLCHNLN